MVFWRPKKEKKEDTIPRSQKDAVRRYLDGLWKETRKNSQLEYRIGMPRVSTPRHPVHLILSLEYTDGIKQMAGFQTVLATYPSPGCYTLWWSHDNHYRLGEPFSVLIREKSRQYKGYTLTSQEELGQVCTGILEEDGTRVLELYSPSMRENLVIEKPHPGRRQLFGLF